MAASVAHAVAWNNGEMMALLSMRTLAESGAMAVRAFAVENATKMSPEPFPPNPPWRPRPTATRFTRRCSW